MPLTPRPAATVMLICDAPDGSGGIAVFLMRRHSAMEFAAGVMVFPGGGVDDRDHNAQTAWAGPSPSWWAQRLPPTWTQLDSLSGYSVRDVLAAERQIVPVQPQLEIKGDQWEFEFFDPDCYNQARISGGSSGWPL